MGKDHYRSSAARELVKAIRKAGGQVVRTGRGRLLVTGPTGSVTIQEPASETRKDLQRSSAWKLIAEQTGIDLIGS